MKEKVDPKTIKKYVVCEYISKCNNCGYVFNLKKQSD